MRAILFIILLMSCLSAHSAALKLAWTDTNSPPATNFILYATTATGPLQPLVSVGTNQTATITVLTNGIWKFAVTAVRNGLESDLSAIVVADFPAPPTNVRTVNLQVTASLTNNVWQNIGFFRVEILP